MRLILSVILLVLLLLVHIFCLQITAREWKALPQGEGASFIIPSTILKASSLEFDGLASDLTFLEGLIFLGSTYERTEKPRVKEWEWRWLYQIMNASTELDPYFLDPYYVSQANFTWDGNLIKETNSLLEKGFRHRDWDWTIPFYLGFNYFYFLQDNERASFYLMEASKRPGAASLLPQLAARLAYKADRTENAIIFLQEILARTDDDRTKKLYEVRLEALRGILFLEKAAALFKKRFNKHPSRVEELMKEGIIDYIPSDPYGGTFYIDKDGSIKTTSELRHK